MEAPPMLFNRLFNRLILALCCCFFFFEAFAQSEEAQTQMDPILNDSENDSAAQEPLPPPEPDSLPPLPIDKPADEPVSELSDESIAEADRFEYCMKLEEGFPEETSLFKQYIPFFLERAPKCLSPDEAAASYTDLIDEILQREDALELAEDMVNFMDQNTPSPSKEEQKIFEEKILSLLKANKHDIVSLVEKHPDIHIRFLSQSLADDLSDAKANPLHIPFDAKTIEHSEHFNHHFQIIRFIHKIHLPAAFCKKSPAFEDTPFEDIFFSVSNRIKNHIGTLIENANDVPVSFYPAIREIASSLTFTENVFSPYQMAFPDQTSAQAEGHVIEPWLSLIQRLDDKIKESCTSPRLPSNLSEHKIIYLLKDNIPDNQEKQNLFNKIIKNIMSSFKSYVVIRFAADLENNSIYMYLIQQN